MKTAQIQIRQGDVLLRPVKALPAGCTPIEPEGGRRFVLAHGEVTGHAHAIYEFTPDEQAEQELAKPTVTVEVARGRRRLHKENGPALESAIENLYFVHGVLVPAFVVVRPDWITLEHIEKEKNAEVRRIMIDRFGHEKYLRQSNAKLIDSCPEDHPMIGLRTAKLWSIGDMTMLDLLNSTPEPDGTVKRYVIPVDGALYDGLAGRSCHAASASTWRMRGDKTKLAFAKPEDYAPEFES